MRNSFMVKTYDIDDVFIKYSWNDDMLSFWNKWSQNRMKYVMVATFGTGNTNNFLFFFGIENIDKLSRYTIIKDKKTKYGQ